MKNIIYFFSILLSIFLVFSCTDDEADRAEIGTLEDGIVNLNFPPATIMKALEEEYETDFDFISVDSIYFQTDPDQFLFGTGTTRTLNADGSIVSGHFITRVPFEMDGNTLYLTPDHMNKGESCSGNPCAQCMFEPNGAGCCCVGGGTICNHTISRYAHSKGGGGGLNELFEC